MFYSSLLDLKYQPIITADANSCKAEIQALKIKPSEYNAETLYALEKSLSESHPPNPFIIMITDSMPKESPTVLEVVSAVNTSKTKVRKHLFYLDSRGVTLDTNVTNVSTVSGSKMTYL